MQSLHLSDPLVWLLMSYLLGTLACGTWTVLVRAVRSMPRLGQRDPTG